jgi:hypothetical protein
MKKYRGVDYLELERLFLAILRIDEYDDTRMTATCVRKIQDPQTIFLFSAHR